MKLVELELFCDDATGGYGFAHRSTISNLGSYDAFNAFYNPIGLLHDVFEHEHEGEKYFRGNAFMNVGGEIAAAGSGIYIADLIGSRRYIGWRQDAEVFINNTSGIIRDGIKYGNFSFGDMLECHVPKQGPVECSLEYVALTHWNKHLKDVVPDADSEYFGECMQYKKSFTLEKLRRLYRWGYRKAQRRIGDNAYLINSFLNFFNVFTKELPAKELWNIGFRYMDITWNKSMWRGKLYGSYTNPIHFNMESSPHRVVERIF